MDAVLTSDGIIDAPPALIRDLVARTHNAGALWIADEVQSGHGRTGAAMWGYQRLGITPDIVTVGKPMGNGMPIAAVLTRREVARAFSPEGEFFSTFGGNPVAAAAALAVLQLMDDERIIDNSKSVGQYLGANLRSLAADHPQVADVRQIGLAIGMELVRPGTTEPDPTTTREIVEGMRQKGILIGTTGRHGNVLKIRPPLVFTRGNAGQVVETLSELLSAG
jgi:4-aminobutyrate aminotransferase-like enzyme